jgi:hypothetical protein
MVQERRKKRKSASWLMVWCILPGLFLTVSSLVVMRINPVAAQSDLSYEKLGVVEQAVLNECSGLVASGRYQDCVWAHNDSGGKPELFLLSKSGELRCVLEVDTKQNKDWEDICTVEHQGRVFLAIGDFGDNSRKRKRCHFILVEEPAVDLIAGNVTRVAAKPALTIAFEYEDGAHDCEACAFDQKTGTILLVTKELVLAKGSEAARGPGVYSLNLSPSLKMLSAGANSDKEIELTAVRLADSVQDIVTGMDISRDGRLLAVRSYFYVYFYVRGAEESWLDVVQRPASKGHRLPVQRQGESLCFLPAGNKLLSISEGKRQPVLEIAIPEEFLKIDP